MKVNVIATIMRGFALMADAFSGRLMPHSADDSPVFDSDIEALMHDKENLHNDFANVASDMRKAFHKLQTSYGK